jgi:hypothetical protein
VTLAVRSARPRDVAETQATEANGLATLFERARRRATRTPTLASALLTTGAGRYLFRRALPPFARVPVRTVLHAAEVIVLADFVELGLLGWLLAIRSATVLVGAFHWGALEPFRQSMRRHVSLGRKGDAEAELARYLRLSLDLCLLLLVVVVGFTELGPRPFPTFSIFDAYAIGCTVRAMAEAVTRTLHAGAFALRRVRRPLGSFVLQDLVDLGVPLVLWPWLGPWGFALGQLCGAAVEAGLTAHYVRRTYASLGLSVPTFRRIAEERARVPLAVVRGMLAPGVGNLFSQVDALLVAVLVAGAGAELFVLVALLHVLRPVLSLSSSWARSFYFDLARLEGPLHALFRPRLERRLLHAIPWFVVVSGLTALGIGVLLTRTAPVPGVAWVLPFLAARAFYAVAQLRAFVRGAYRRLLAGAAVLVLAVWLLPQVSGDVRWQLVAASASLTVVGALFFAASPVLPEPSDASPLLRPLPFLAGVARLPRSHELALVTLSDAAGIHVPAVARALAALPGVELAARLDRRLVALASEPGTLRSPALVTASGGSALRLERLPIGDEGRTALVGLFGMTEGPGLDEAALRAEFTRRFPDGTVLDAHSGALPPALATPRELGLTLSELGALASGIRPSRRRGLRACVYAPHAEARLVFFPPPAADAGVVSDFQRVVTRASVHATLGV